MDTTDLSNLSPEEARDYVLAHITTLNQTRRQREQTESEIALWEERSRMAADRGALDLSEKAKTVVGQLSSKRDTLKGEEESLQALVAVLKEKLKRHLLAGARLVDTDRLLAELEMAVGEEKAAELATDRALEEARAQTALEELKKKMRGGS